MTARASGSTSVTEVAAGNISGTYSLTLGTASETWVTASLTGNTTVTITGLTAGKLVKLFVTQDSTGGWTLDISDGAVSASALVNTAPTASSALTVFSPDGTEFVVSGGAESRAPSAKTANYTLAATDVGGRVEVNSSSAKVVTIPSDASASIGVGDSVDVSRIGTGQVTFAAEAGVALNPPLNRKITAQYGVVRAFKRAANNWQLDGDLSATTSFDPSTLSPSAWFKGDAITGLANGAAVSQWDDSSGNARHATQATGSKQPTYVAGARNGLGAVRFDGTSDVLNCTGIKSDTAARTIFAVAVETSNPGHIGIVWALNDQGTNMGDRSGAWSFSANEANGDVTIGGSVASLSLVTIKFTNTGSADWYLNAGTATNFNPKDVYQSLGGLSMTIGAHGNDLWFCGDICEVMVVDSALNDTDRGNMASHLITKWGIT